MSDWFEKLFINEVKGALVKNTTSSGGSSTGGTGSTNMVDASTGKEYVLEVVDGELTMREVN